MKFKNLEYVYFASLKFGINKTEKLVIAKDFNDAIKTINDYYDVPIIVSIFSFNELLDILDKIEKEENVFIVFEIVLGKNGLDAKNYIHLNTTIENLTNQYKDTETIIFSKEALMALSASIFNSLEDYNSKPLISDYIKL